MNGGSGARCYVVLGRQPPKQGHREVEKLTAMHLEVVAASGEASKQWFDGGGNLEREGGRG